MSNNRNDLARITQEIELMLGRHTYDLVRIAFKIADIHKLLDQLKHGDLQNKTTLSNTIITEYQKQIAALQIITQYWITHKKQYAKIIQNLDQDILNRISELNTKLKQLRIEINTVIQQHRNEEFIDEYDAHLDSATLLPFDSIDEDSTDAIPEGAEEDEQENDSEAVINSAALLQSGYMDRNDVDAAQQEQDEDEIIEFDAASILDETEDADAHVSTPTTSPAHHSPTAVVQATLVSVDDDNVIDPNGNLSPISADEIEVEVEDKYETHSRKDSISNSSDETEDNDKTDTDSPSPHPFTLFQQSPQHHHNTHIDHRNLIILADDYRRRSFLALHSNHHEEQRDTIHQRYFTLLTSYHELIRDNTIDFNTQHDALPKVTQIYSNKTYETDEKDKREKEYLQHTRALQQTFYFGQGYKIVANQDVDQTLASIQTQFFQATPNHLSQPITDTQARITQMDLDTQHQGTLVEKYRVETHGKKTFISETHISKDIQDTQVLKSWAANAISSFFAAAPKTTKKVKFEDGYTPKQLAALISYCNFMGYSWEIGEEQILRIEARVLHHDKKIDDDLLNKLENYQPFTLSDTLKTLAQSVQDVTLWSQWAALNSEFSEASWQAWCDNPRTHQNHPHISLLGQKRHHELLAQYQTTAANTHSPATPSPQGQKRSYVSKRPSPISTQKTKPITPAQYFSRLLEPQAQPPTPDFKRMGI